MGGHSDRAREALMDAAEELFAKEGIDAVSNRRIAEHAGTANHSAVAYHFGGREELLVALVARHFAVIESRRAELAAELDDDPGVHDLVRCRLMPFVEQLDRLPRPSWRARFLAQVRTVPSAREVVAEALRETEITGDMAAIEARIPGVPRRTLAARSRLVADVVITVCSDRESAMSAGEESAGWPEIGMFLVDVAVGMLAAPVTPVGRRKRASG